MFDIEDDSIELDSAASQTSETSKTRRKPKRQRLPKDLPRVVIRHEAKTHCPDCGETLHCIGEDRSEKLIFIPAKVEVEQHVRPKCVCRHCEQQGKPTAIHQAPMPATVFPKSIATPSLVAHMIAMKFQHGLPLTRVSSLLDSWHITLNRRTIADWMMQASRVLEPVWAHLRHTMLQFSWLYADETPVNVIDSEKSKTYMWVYCSGNDGPAPPSYDADIKNIVLYDHQLGRSGRHAVDFLDGYSGYLQVDGIEGISTQKLSWLGATTYAVSLLTLKKCKAAMKAALMALTYIKKLYRTEGLLKESDDGKGAVCSEAINL